MKKYEFADISQFFNLQFFNVSYGQTLVSENTYPNQDLCSQLLCKVLPIVWILVWNKPIVSRRR